MKIRIGVGGAPVTLSQLTELVAVTTESNYDSIWLPEVLSSPGLDPLVALATAAALHPSIKLGATVLFTGTNPVRLARRLAAVDQLSSGRLLVTAVPGIAQGPEPAAIGLPTRSLGTVLEDTLTVVRALWQGERVDHEGPAGNLAGVTISPRPHQAPLEVWIGGTSVANQERAGRVGDGWLPALVTPTEAAQGLARVHAAAAAASREVSEEHFGVSIAYRTDEVTGPQLERLTARIGARPLDDVAPASPEALVGLLERFIAEGFSKFVVRPLCGPERTAEVLAALAPAVVGLQR